MSLSQAYIRNGDPKMQVRTFTYLATSVYKYM